MRPFVSLVTLGVRDIEAARRFYVEGLGWPVSMQEDNWTCFLPTNSSGISLFPWDELADDAGVPAGGTGFRGVTLAYNVRSESRVDEVLQEAARAGGSVVQPARTRPWGIYSGYFADVDGHLWEVATGADQIPYAEER
jgi:catechol 2,3-dioxygenase-like lactoylglutathione lyase family enzyme